eukprot:GILI01010628.1.p2 GENE.GILI01010628.1~~GILI01010628.1.p2  ORF type:complete len:459 (+),score=158.80 GILI01010628.1:94-1377(+)
MPSEQKDSVLVIVDPFSSGRFLVDEALKKNYKIVAVQSSSKLSTYFSGSLKREKYVDLIVHGESMEETVQALAKYDVLAVIAGSEPGVEVADQLSSALNMPTANDLSLSAARRNKFLMNERIRECGLRACAQFMSGSTDAVVQWAQNWNRFPVVVKPTTSLGTDGVSLCDNIEQVRAACDRVLGQVNPAGQVNEQVVVQEFLKGTEFVVDSVTFNGEHHLVVFWKYAKAEYNGSKFVYLSTNPQPVDIPEGEALTKYAHACVSALGIRYGPTHVEVMWTEEGPILIEVNCRMHGSLGPYVSSLCQPNSQIDLTLDVYTGGSLFQQVKGQPFRLDKLAYWLNYISTKDGILNKSLSDRDEIRALPTYVTSHVPLSAGDRVHKTIDLLTSPGCLVFVDVDEEKLKEDERRFRELEATVLYDVTEDTPSA